MKEQQFIKEVKQYFVDRGWDNKTLFYMVGNKDLKLTLTFFNYHNNKTGKKIEPLYITTCRLLTKEENFKFVKYIFEHISYLWIKHNMGDRIIECSDHTKIKIQINKIADKLVLISN